MLTTLPRKKQPVMNLQTRPRNDNRILRYRPMHSLTDIDLKISTWNILTMLQPGKMAEIAAQLLKYKINVAGLQEIRFSGQGEIKKKDFSLFYSGAKRPGQFGTGFFIDKNTRNSILEFEAVNDRICYMRLKGKFQNMSFMVVHAPTEDAEEQIKDDFYDTLGNFCNRISRHDIIILLGDFNAKIGQESFTSDVCGRYSLHDATNENGMRICNFAASMGLWISSVSFPHKNIHKQTWKIPGSTNANQIDHVLIDKRHATSIIDVRSFRGANCDSDHFLVVAKLRQRISKVINKNAFRRTIWDTEKIVENLELRASYQSSMATKLNSWQYSDDEPVSENWSKLKNAVTETAERIIGKKITSNNDWYDQECAIVNEIKNQARTKYLERPTRSNLLRYHEKRKNAKQILKRKKKNEIETANRTN
ncbi:craniofacial development protein 2-like [Condylostylus longicornis]|uniref:craniofacial development protein 2-like n=1 Tax=Condylostylus longicornis TaxID=2530218 RepID=UPI00244DDA67|nr:craniofacial development protein 2-like [Condylostylus longicornis]